MTTFVGKIMDLRRSSTCDVWIVLILLGVMVDLPAGYVKLGKNRSCIGRCGTPSTYTSCGCDSKCLEFGDCCLDFQTFCENISIPERNLTTSSISSQFKEEYRLFSDYTSCISVQKLAQFHEYPSKFLMVYRCPEDWLDNNTRHLCNSNKNDNVLSLLHVQSTSGVVFKNTFCAYCHGLSLDDVILWRLLQNPNATEIRIQSPRSPWGMNLQICDSERELYIRSCPNGAQKHLAVNCSLFLNPYRGNVTKSFFKNKYCAECHNTTVKLVEQTILPTFDVIFGFHSWKEYKASCHVSGVDDDFDQVIFGNACEMFKRFLQDQIKPPSCDIKACLSNFTFSLFQREANNSFRTNIINQSCDSFEVELILPSMLAYILLNTTINSGNVTLTCDVKLNVMLSRQYKITPFCHDSGQREIYQPLVDITCRNYCHVNTAYLLASTCAELFSSQLNCTGSEVIILPPYSVEVVDFDKEKIKYYETDVILNRDQFDLTPDYNIRTCEEYIRGHDRNVTMIIQIIGSCFSMLGILLVIGIHLKFPVFQTLHGFCLVNLCIAFFMLFLFLLTSAVAQKIPFLAQTFNMLIHYTFLTVFAWQMVIAFHVARSFGKNIIANRMSKVSAQKEAILYLAVAWGAPLPFLITGVILHVCSCSRFSYGHIWMLPSKTTTMVFHLPLGIFVLLSAILFFIALRNIERRQHTSTASSKGKVDNCFVALRLAVITGLPWLLTITYALFPKTFLQPIVTGILALQGVFIFVAFVTTTKVRGLLLEKFRASYSHDSNNARCIENEES